MADISMCRNNLCPLKDKCYRYNARPSEWQSYGSYYPIMGKCHYFWPMEDGDEQIRAT